MSLARLLPLALVAVLAASCSGDDKSSSTTTAATTTVAALPAPTSPGTLKAGKRNLYPALAGSLASVASKPVNASSTTIVALAGLDSFWAGFGNRRVLVKIDLKGKRPPTLQVNRQVSFTGRFVKAPKDASSLGVKPKTGQAVLTKQGYYVVVPLDKLTLQ